VLALPTKMLASGDMPSNPLDGKSPEFGMKPAS